MNNPTRTVLVTGAARRLGKAIALAFARAGWQVAVHYHRSADDAQHTVAELSQHAPACAFAANLSDTQATLALPAAVAAHFGSLDAVVNNASHFDYDDPMGFHPEHLQAHLGPNLSAPILLAQALAQQLAAQGPQARGVVINLLDQKLWNYNPDFFSYTLTKAALHAATTMLAQALAPAVRVVGVAPGLTLPSHLQTDADFQRTHALSPLGHGSHVEDVVRAVLFAADNASITGSTLLVDGGQHLMGLPRDFSLL